MWLSSAAKFKSAFVLWLVPGAETDALTCHLSKLLSMFSHIMFILCFSQCREWSNNEINTFLHLCLLLLHISSLCVFAELCTKLITDYSVDLMNAMSNQRRSDKSSLKCCGGLLNAHALLTEFCTLISWQILSTSKYKCAYNVIKRLISQCRQLHWW